MEPRFELKKAAQDAFNAVSKLEAYVRQSGLEPAPLELVRLRASEINSCAFCVDMHTKDTRAAGEAQRRRQHIRDRSQKFARHGRRMGMRAQGSFYHARRSRKLPAWSEPEWFRRVNLPDFPNVL